MERSFARLLSYRMFWLLSLAFVLVALVLGLVNSNLEILKFTSDKLITASIFLALFVFYGIASLEMSQNLHRLEVLEQKVKERTVDLTRSESRYRTLVDNIRDGIIIIDLRTQKILYTSLVVPPIFESKAPQSSDQPFDVFGRIPYAQIQMMYEDLTQLDRGFKVPIRQYRALTITGKNIWLETTFSKIEYDGRPCALLLVTNISDLKQTEDEIQRLKNFNEGIVQSLAVGIVVQDENGSITFVNPAGATLMGYTPQELVGKHWSSIIPSDQKRIIEAADARRMQNQSDRYEVELIGKDGRRIPILVSGSPRFQDGNYIGNLAVFTDISKLKQVEAAIGVSEERYRHIAEFAADLRTAADRDQIISVVLDRVSTLFQSISTCLFLSEMGARDTIVFRGQGVWAHMDEESFSFAKTLNEKVINSQEMTILSKNDPELFTNNHHWLDKVGSITCMPLITQEQKIGSLWIGMHSKLDEDEVLLLSAIVDSAANAIYRASLHEETQRRLQRLTALRNIDMTITSSLDLRLTLDILLSQVTSLLNVDAASILLYNPHLQTLEYTNGHGFRSDAVARTKLNLGEGLAGKAALDRQIVHSSNLSRVSDSIKRSSLLIGENFVTYFGVPLLAKGSVKGVLEIFHRSALSTDPEWLDFLQALAAQAAIAIDNAKMFDDLQRSNIELIMAYDATLEGWTHALDLRDKETEGHTQRVTAMTIQLAREIGMSEEEMIHVRRGALLHDIGKMGIPDNILRKAGPLNDEEWVIMRKHPVYAYDMLCHIAYLQPALDIPYCHHEKWDGTGYPRQLSGDQIPLSARAFSIVDVWDALRSDRPYRMAWSDNEVISYIRSQAGKMFDPQIAEIFIRLFEREYTPIYSINIASPNE